MSKRRQPGYYADSPRQKFSDVFFSHPVVPLRTLLATVVTALSINSLAHLGDGDPGYVGAEPVACRVEDQQGVRVPTRYYAGSFIYDVIDFQEASGTRLLDQSAHQPDWTFQSIAKDRVLTGDDESEVLCTVPSDEAYDGEQFVITRTGQMACDAYQAWIDEQPANTEASYPSLERFCA